MQGSITPAPERGSNRRGFTIVELLIVIVIIGILAAITIVSYNGVTARAKNAKTTAAVGAWVSAIKLYQADNNSYPSQNSCLGNATTYPGNSCASLYGWSVDVNFTTKMQQYFNGGVLPEPDITKVGTDNLVSGAFYVYNSGSPFIWYVQVNTNSCPSIGGLTIYQSDVFPGGVYCYGTL